MAKPLPRRGPHVFYRYFYVQIGGNPRRCRAALENTRKASKGVRACVAVMTVCIEGEDDE